jgi:nucleotide-binding universal stress UspA family protein
VEVPNVQQILDANDGSEHAFQAFLLALTIARQNSSELHMVCIEEIDYTPSLVLVVK